MFANREEAGRLLAQKLVTTSPGLILGIPRGGVVVAKEIAQSLNRPWDILVAKKIGAPRQPELAIGAVGPYKTFYWDMDLCYEMGVSEEQRYVIKAARETQRRQQEQIYRQGKRAKLIGGKHIILVDDGVATGATVIVAVLALRKRKPLSVTLATPVIAKETLRNMIRFFDEVVYLIAPAHFESVGKYYKEFPQIEDKQVLEMLGKSQ